MRLFFWLCITIIVYHSLIYPGMVWLLAKTRPRPVNKQEFSPMVTIVVPVYNEEKIIEEKILNTLQIDYPKEKLEIIFASDGSNDRTNDVIHRYLKKGITLIDRPKHLGKTELLNQVIPKAKGEIVVLTDASGMLNKEAVREMVKSFYDSQVGCVCGIYHIAGEDKAQVDRFEEIYLDFETILKKSESLIYTTLGGQGALYAIRKSLFKPLKKDLINEDFLISSNIVLQGFRTVYEEKALVYDKIHTTVRDEFRRRIRISAGNWQQAIILKEIFNLRKYFIAWQFISHKILRTVTPVLLIFIFITSIFLDALIYKIVLSALSGFIVLAILGWAFRRQRRNYSLFRLSFYVCLENIAYLVGTYKFLFAKKGIKW